MCCSQHELPRPPESRRESLTALLGHPHVDGPTIALIQIWLFMLNVLACITHFTRCLESCLHFLRPVRLMSIMTNAIIHKTSAFGWKGGVCHVRLESHPDESLLSRARKKLRVHPKRKQRKPIVIFEARWCGRSRIAERYKTSLKDACKRKQPCCRCLARRQKGDRQLQKAMFAPPAATKHET